MINKIAFKETIGHTKIFKSAFIFCILLISVGIFLYGKTIGFDYLWDDDLLFLQKNELLTKPLSWSMLAQPVLEGTTYMRPLVFLSWYIEFNIFGQNPKISHAINVIIYLFNVLLVFSILVKILKNKNEKYIYEKAFLGALIYCVHPLLIESTAWVSGRFDLMCTSFILLATLTAISNVKCKAIIIATFTLLALFSKELGVIAPLVIFCICMSVFADNKKSFLINAKEIIFSNIRLCVILVCVMVFYFIIRKLSMHDIYHDALTLNYYKTAIFTKMLPLVTLREYFLLAVFPFNGLGIFHPESTIEFDSASILFKNFVTFVLFMAVIWAAVVSMSSWAWMLMASFFSIILVLHFIPMTINDNIAQERFMALPLAYICIAFVLLPWKALNNLLPNFKISVKKISAYGLLLGWIVIASLVSFTYIPMWRTSLLLWSWAHSQYPELLIIRHNYMEAALTAGRSDLFEKEINRLQKKYSGLELGEQALYANYLLRIDDPESMKYLEGLFYAYPDFHLLNISPSKYWISSWSSMGGAYYDYSIGKIIFYFDLSRGLKYNKIAQWYLKSSQLVEAQYIESAILYLLGDRSGSMEILAKNNGIYFYNRTRMQTAAETIIKKYCENIEEKNIGDNKNCQNSSEWLDLMRNYH